MKIYGEFFDDRMKSRMTRDGIASVTRVAFNRNGRYAVRGYVRPNPHNSEEVYFYHLRRDGRVEQSWVPLAKSGVIEQGEELSQ